MAKAKVPRLPKLAQPIMRGDTPLMRFDLVDSPNIDLSEWQAYITITPNPAPDNNDDALVAKELMAQDGDSLTYQLTHSISSQFNPEATYYGDIELTKNPEETNVFTVARFMFSVDRDYGI